MNSGTLVPRARRASSRCEAARAHASKPLTSPSLPHRTTPNHPGNPNRQNLYETTSAVSMAYDAAAARTASGQMDEGMKKDLRMQHFKFG